MALPLTERYHRNQAALRAFQPSVAAALDEVLIPEEVKPATGRDGSDTFLIPDETGRPVWFGGSSMPGISASEIFAGFRGDGSNVSLPGVLTGVEPLVVASKMATHTALFVVEQDPLQLKLAMHLRDYSDLFAGGRLVFVFGKDEDLARNLCTFFESHPGYELPTRLLTVPQRSAAEIADLQRDLEAAGKAAAAVYARLVESHVQALGSRERGPLPPAPRVTALSIDPRPGSLEQARRIGRALTKLQWSHQLCIPDAPDKCHITARLRAVNEVAADLVLFVNSMAGPMRPLLPDNLPVASWFLPEAVAQPFVAEEPRGGDVIFASSRTLHDRLTAAGVPAGVIERSEVAADDTVYRPVILSASGDRAMHVDVAILMDLPDDRPEACDITLASHLALWRALQATVEQNADRYRDDIAEELLDMAQRDSGTRLQDPKVRRHFVSLIQARIAPAMIARAAAKRLISADYRVGLWGCNWPQLMEAQEIRRGPIPTGEALNEVFNAARIVILPDSSAQAVQTMLDAFATGTPVICRQPDQPFEQEYPTLIDLVPHLHFYRSSRELLDSVHDLTGGDKGASERARAVRAMVCSKHTVAERLTAIVETLRRRQALNVRSWQR